MRSCVCALAVSSTVWLVACEFNPVGPGTAGSTWLTATVQGSTLQGPFSTEYAGSGHFITLPSPRRPAAPAAFLLQSQGRDASRGEGFELWGAGNAVPDVGVYPLSANAAGGTFGMVFTQRRGNVTYRYGAEAGELHITSASPDRVTGSFTFTGTFVGTCTTNGGAVACTPSAAPEGQPTSLAVSGSFEAAASR